MSICESIEPISEAETSGSTETISSDNSLYQELNHINNDIASVLQDMCEQTGEGSNCSPLQTYMMSTVTEVLKHIIQPNGVLYFQVSFNTNECGGRRWMSASCLRHRPELVAKYWNERALRLHREYEYERRILEMETTVFGIYDF